MADHTFELPPTPPTAPSGPAIDPSLTAVPAAPRPTAPVPPSTTSSPWYPQFELPSAAPAGLAASTASARARRAAASNRTRVIVGGASVASFLAILAAVGLHGGSQPASNVNATNGDPAASFDPGFARPDLGQSGSGSGVTGSGSAGSSPTDPFGSTGSPFSGRFSGGFSGGFSATPGSGGSSANTRSHGS